MAEIVGCLGMSHSPQLLMPALQWGDLPDRVRPPFNPPSGIENELGDDVFLAKEKRCQDAIAALKTKLDDWAPDVVVIVGDDQEENIQADNTPPFTIFIGDEADAGRKFHYLGENPVDQTERYPMQSDLALELVDTLMDEGFDPAWSRHTRYEAGLGHAFGRPLHYLMPKPNPNRRVVPVMLNTFYDPAPTAARCYDFGAALGSALRQSDKADRIVVIASGGLSHTKINEALDQAFIDALERFDPDYFKAMPASDLVHGTSELRNWIAVAAIAGQGAKMIDYVPCYRNANGVGCAMGFAYWEQK